MMRASIITPTYNAVSFIEECVNNVALQGDSVLEHIIVDGGSVDGTVEAIIRLQKRYSHIRYIKGPDKGQSDAMNKGTLASNGQVIGILNVDDSYETGAVSEAVSYLSRQHKPTLVVGVCQIIDHFHDLVVWNRPVKLLPEYLLQNSQDFPAPANPSAYFYHRSVHDIVGGYDIEDRYAMDLEFILTCAERVECHFVDRHWGNFRLIPGCKTYENIANGPHLVASLIDAHSKNLSARQRFKMAWIRLEIPLRKKAWHALHRIGLK